MNFVVNYSTSNHACLKMSAGVCAAARRDIALFLFNALKGGGMKFRSMRSDRRAPSVTGDLLS
jgi:hypothetical protein